MSRVSVSKQFVFAAVIAAAFLFWISGTGIAEAKFIKAMPAVPGGIKPLAVDLGVGKRGFLAISWLERRTGGDGITRIVARARVKQPADTRPREATTLGLAGPGDVNVEIGPSNLTVLTWTGRDGYTRYTMRRPNTGWTSVQTIGGAVSTDNELSIGPDGTVIVADVVAESVEDPNAKVQVSLRMPGSPSFSAWRTVSTGAEIVGFDVDVVAQTKGRGTVAWSGFCTDSGPGNPAYYVDVEGGIHTAPVALENSRCTVWDLNLENDRHGRQYLAIGTWTGLKFARRQPGKEFPPMASLTNSYRQARADLSVSWNGNMTLLWTRTNSSGLPTAYRYVTSRKTSEIAPARNIKGPWMNPKGVRDFLLDSAPLPSGKLAQLWTRTWTDSGRRFRHTFGTGVWKPGSRFERPRYRFSIGRLRTPFPAQIETAIDGSRLTWWKEENDRGSVLDVRFTIVP